MTGLIHIFSNSKSGKNKNHVLAGQICSGLLNLGFGVMSHEITDNDDLKTHIESLTSLTCKIIIPIGGDGTISSAAQALAGHPDPPVLAPYPGGTTNDFCRSYGISFNVEAFCKAVKMGIVKKIDLAKCGSQYFINVLSAGNFVDSAFTIDPALKERFGSMGYYLEVAKKLSDQNVSSFAIDWEANVSVSTDNKASRFSKGHEKIMFMLIANGPSAGGFNFFPGQESNYNEGLLDIIMIRECDLLDLVALFFMLLNKSHLDDYRVIHFRASKIIINPEKKLTFTIDGEKGGTLPGAVENIPGALKIIDFKTEDNDLAIMDKQK